MTLAERAGEIQWWHAFHFPDGTVVQGRTDPAGRLLPHLDLPTDMNGLTVLDVATWDGAMAYACEKRGAQVTATDDYVWEPKPHMWCQSGKKGFDLAHEAFDSKVKAIHASPYDLSPEKIGTFDIVLCLGLLYHVPYPFLLLEKMRALTHGVLVVESHLWQDGVSYPAMKFWKSGELGGDITNRWSPNAACILLMLERAGFPRAQHIKNWMSDRGIFKGFE